MPAAARELDVRSASHARTTGRIRAPDLMEYFTISSKKNRREHPAHGHSFCHSARPFVSVDIQMKMHAAAVVLAAAIAGADQHPTSALEISHRARRVTPGEVVIVEVRPAEALTDVSGQMDGARIYFHRAAENRWEGLVGLDAEAHLGDHTVAVRATTTSGNALRRDYPLRVESHTFTVRRLAVPEAFVNPPPDTAARIREDRKTVEAVFASVSPEQWWTEPFVMPVTGPVTSDFGRQSILNGVPRSRHLGTDFRAPAGSIVVSPNRGRVALVHDQYFSGRTVIIDHGWGLYSLFAHLERVLIGEGDVVDRGQSIALSGATGRVTGPHLHWSVRLGATHVDPVSLVAVTARPPQ